MFDKVVEYFNNSKDQCVPILKETAKLVHSLKSSTALMIPEGSKVIDGMVEAGSKFSEKAVEFKDIILESGADPQSNALDSLKSALQDYLVEPAKNNPYIAGGIATVAAVTIGYSVARRFGVAPTYQGVKDTLNSCRKSKSRV